MTGTLSPVARVIISGNRSQDDHIPEISALFTMLRRSGIFIEVHRRLADYLRQRGVDIPEIEIVDEPGAGIGAAISLGGDGTFLRTARWIGKREIPVLGINTGHLGFLATYTPAEMESLVNMLRSGDGIVEERIALQVEVGEGCEAPALPYAINEVAILKEDTASMINVNVSVQDHYLADYMADGLLISTPTGSTGYSLSAGGPIISPTLDVVCITPVAPHTMTFRPFVVSASEVIHARTTSRAPRYRVSLDGVSFLMPEGSEICVRRADFRPKVIRKPEDSFADTLRHKLLWGMR